MTVLSLHPSDMADEIINLRNELAVSDRLIKEQQALIDAQQDELANCDRIVGEQSTAISTAHSALLAARVSISIIIDIIDGLAPGMRK